MIELAKNKLGVIILAAGKGTRMENPEMLKVMYEINGKPMVNYVVNLAMQLNAAHLFPGLRWTRRVTVRTTTLDALIEEHGEPTFCKLDVEGYELQSLKGLSWPLRCLSFEYMPHAMTIACACIDRIQELAEYEFNWSGGESMKLGLAEWVDSSEIKKLLHTKPDGFRSGDVYARRIVR